MGQSVAQVSSDRPWFWSLLRADTSKRLFVTDPRVRIFLLSFAMLFFELLCIRWIPSYVRYLSYFNNFILLASFLGIGLGMLAARRQRFWFPVLALPLLLLSARWTILATALVLLASIAVAWQMQLGAFWSPYYKILLHPAVPSGYIVDVNNAGGHQSMIPWQYKEPFYRRVYELFPGRSFHHALILGAGSGSDTSTALAYGVQSITAVEIDPTIQKLGTQYNPDHPYSNSRVKVVINDGRNYLQNTTER